jgi:cellulose synthase/poly-beta-1,6-N-acetylglucosamine synthase-like glycosyltransferase
MSVFEVILQVFAWVALVYFTGLSLVYLVFTFVAWHRLAAFRRARAYLPLDEIFASPITPAASVLLPAFNEETVVVPSVTSLLDLRYPQHEVIVINDGSTDGTLERLREAFDLVPVRQAMRTRIATAPVRGAYVSRSHRNLRVLDKENGGKSDALNAGVNAAAHLYVCAVDADAILEEDALLRVVKPVVDDPEVVVAAGGIVRVANGCRIEGGRVVEFGLPRNRLAAMQVVEYFRAFLIGRIGWDSINGLLIISGAFGLFSRPFVEAVGGYSRETVGEDVELVAHLQVHLRERGDEFRIAFVPDPVCWTEAPESLSQLSSQRRRWSRGLGETLWRYRRRIFNPRFGTFGLLALPQYLLFEFLGAIVELLGLAIVLVAWLLGVLSLSFFLAFLAVSILLSVLLSIGAILLEEYAVRRHERSRDIARLVLYAVAENFGFRQLTAFYRCLGVIDLIRGRKDWGEMERRGLERRSEAPLPSGERTTGS